jgi:hypothetical protein
MASNSHDCKEIKDSTIPYFIFSIGQIERHFQVINDYGFKEYFTRFSENSVAEITQKFKYKQLFLQEFEDFFHL